MSAVPSTTEAAPGLSAGQLLRQAREASGLHVAALAVSLKVPVRKLEALEGDRHDLLPDAVFARALASSVCRTLKIDARPVLDRLPQGGAPRLVQDHEGLNAPFRAPGDAAAPGWRESLLRPVPLLVGALLVGALVILLLPSLKGFEPAVAAPAEAVPPPLVPVPMAAPALAAESPAPAPAAPALAEQPPAKPEQAAAVPPPPAAPTPVAAVATVPATVPAAATRASEPVANGLVVFRATAPSWIEVTDSKGTVAVRRTLEAGESVGATGNLPLSVVVGSASVTAVEVRGKRFDLAPVTRDNVARFEVK